MELLLTRESPEVQIASNRRWLQVQIELDNEFGTEAVEASMTALSTAEAQNAYLASRKAR